MVDASDENGQTFLLRLSDTLRAQTSFEAVGQRATQLMAQQFGADRVYLVSLNPHDDTVVVTHETRRQNMAPLEGTYHSSDFPAAIQEIFDHTIVYTDVRTDARLTELDRRSFAGLGAVGFIATSIRQGSQSMIWAAGALTTQSRSWTASEVVLFEDAVERTWAALERAQAEQALRQSEAKYRTLFDSIDEGFCVVEVILDENGKPFDLLHLEANPAYESYTGLRGIVGKRSRDIIPDAGPWLDFYGQVALTGHAARNESYLVAPIDRWIGAYASRIGDEGSLKVAIVFDDITERKRREANLAFLAEISQDLVKMSKPDQVLDELGPKIGAYVNTVRVFFVEISEHHNKAIVRDWHSPDLSSVAGQYPLSQFLGERYRQKSRAGNPIVIPDAYQSDLVDGSPLEAVFGVGSLMTIPLVQDGHWVFTLGIHDTVPRAWRADEIDLLQELAGRIWARLEKASAEEALGESQKRFESIANLVPDLLWDSGPDGFTNWYNQRWLDYTGQRFEEAMGWGWTDAIHPDDRAASAQLYKQAVESGTSLRQEHRIRRHDGVYRWFVVCVSPFRDERGQVVKMYGAATDIHESRLAEAALQESEKRLRLAIEATELATWEWNLETDQLYWNEQHFRLLGMEPRPNPLPLDEFMRHVHPQEQARINHLLERTITERGVYEAEFCAVLEDGSQRYMSGYGRITEERDGRPVTMSGVMLDVDDRRRAQDALQLSGERLQKALSIQTVGVTFFDRQTTIQATNEAFLAMSGVSQPAIEQRSVSLIGLTLPPWQPLCQQAMTELMTEGRSMPHEKELLRPDGTRWWGLFAGSRLSEDEFVEFVLDVTERRRAEEALRLADGRKDEFLAMLAHELRNPMSTLRSGLQILSITDGKDQTSRDTLAMMNRQTDHLVRMVDDLLDVSRITQGKIELRPERVNLVSLVQQAVAGCQPLFDQQGKHLHVTLPLTPVELEGDATRLTQVVTNLLTNGVRYTGEGGQVWLSLSHHTGRNAASPTGRNQAILQVRDNGIGLATDQLTAIFELFVQVDNSIARSKGGLGLGLTLVQRLVALHGGHVEAHSEGLGRGSTFTVHLPTLAVAVEPSARSTPQASDSPTSRRILVIDDNEDAAFTLAMLLKLKGYEAHTRTSGRSGLEAAEALQPAAILLDLGMPEMDGYETCRHLRALGWGKRGVIVALSGYGQEEDRRRTSELGFDAHLVKPVDLQALTELLDKLLPTDL